MNTLHYPSLELCKKLPKEICNSGYGYAECQWIGSKKDSIFISKEEFYSVTKSEGNKFIDLNWIFIECPSVMELLDELPDMTVVKDEVYVLQITKGSVEYYSHLMESNIFEAFQPLPDALSYAWLWLKENDLLPKK